jgi:hypothetical protein
MLQGLQDGTVALDTKDGELTMQGAAARVWCRVVWVTVCAILLPGPARAADDELFRKTVAPLLELRCLKCHGDKVRRGSLSLASAKDARAGGDSGPAIIPGKPDKSLLVQQVVGDKPKMPRNAPALTPQQIADLKNWIAAGAPWPESLTLRDRTAGEDWWSLRPLQRPALPALLRPGSPVRNPIDAFILAKLEQEGLAPSPEADRRTLIRRLYYDLLGMPPSPDEVEAFVREESPVAYEALVDRLLASPRYGERWARHWLDVVHYGDTHGYDKDKPRPNAWPYRDYVIRAFNDDRPYDRFVREQLAGDVLFAGSSDGIVALGFLAAGPWDFVGHVELREGTLDKQITRNLDRDDMVSTVMNTFTSLTVQCARCHDHKFDPIGQEDYYSLQAVFAAVDRADRPYDSPETTRLREELLKKQDELNRQKQALNAKLRAAAGPELEQIERRLAELVRAGKGGMRPEFGYHSQIEPGQDRTKWVQVDLGKEVAIESVVYAGCHDTFAGIGAGFGFPVRYKIEIANDAKFSDTVVIEDRTAADVRNPGIRPQAVNVGGKKARFVRVTATKLALRSGDYIFALAELMVLTADGKNAALGATVTALDSIEAPPRWRKTNLVDGWYPGAAGDPAEVARLTQQRQALLERAGDAALQRESVAIELELKNLAIRLIALPKSDTVYAAATQFTPNGGFHPTGGKPRPIHILNRGSEKSPGREVGPGTVACVAGLEARFALPPGHSEGERRAALARWITDERNPLTWRSIVNRVWQYHLGQGLVDTPNDFGRMGGRPTHPELLDWLAVEFRDGGRSLKALHRLIVTSATYRQASMHDPAKAQADAGNRFLWRANRRRLDAESLRDSVLVVAGQFNPAMYGPGFRPFGFQDDHSPHYKYEEYNPDDPASHRRSLYRFLVRSVPDPFMETLDCADPSLRVEKRNETLTAVQALGLLNNRFMVRMAEHLSTRIAKQSGDLPEQITAAYRLALGRAPAPEERTLLCDYARKHGLANACRLIFNTNEFAFVD